MVVRFRRIEWNRRMVPPRSTLFLNLSHRLEVCPVKATRKHVFELKNLNKWVDHSIYNDSYQFAFLRIKSNSSLKLNVASNPIVKFCHAGCILWGKFNPCSQFYLFFRFFYCSADLLYYCFSSRWKSQAAHSQGRAKYYYLIWNYQEQPATQ